MSHITKYETKVTNLNMLHEALESLKKEGKLDYEWLGEGTQKTYSKNTTGTHFKLSNWSYPVCVTPNGDLEFDNYNGSWGKPIMLDQVIQRYQQKLITKRAREQGWQVSATTAENGDVTLHLMQ